MGTLVGFFFLLGFLLYERDQKFVRVFVGRFSHLPNLYITFVAGQVGRHIQWVVRWGDFKKNPPSQSIILLS